MPPTSYSCPSCGATLKSAAPLAEGKAIKCPKCGEVFRPNPQRSGLGNPQLPTSAREPEVERSSPRGELRHGRQEDVDEDEDLREEDRPRRRKARKQRNAQKKGNTRLVLGLIGGGVGLVVLAAAVMGALWAFGIVGGKGSTEANKPGDQPGTTAGTIEFFNPEADIRVQKINDQEVLALHWKVKYRFTAGQPEHGLYQLWVDFGILGTKNIEGSAMKPEGEVEGTTVLPAALKKPPKTVKFKMLFSATGTLQLISNEIECPVTGEPGLDPELQDATPEQNKIASRLLRAGAEVQRHGGINGAVVSVKLRSAKADDGLLAELPKLTDLIMLDLDTSGLTDAGLAHLKDMQSLRILSIGYNEAITDAGLAHVKGLTKLKELMFSRTGVTDAGLEHLKGMNNLVQVYAGCKNITDRGLSHLQALPNLRFLALGDSRVTDEGMAQIKTMRKLEFLVLDRTAVSDAGIAELKGLANLQTLRVVGTQVTDRGATDLRKALPNLKVIQKD